jgi:uncharacterized protein with FMN-binding domain
MRRSTAAAIGTIAGAALIMGARLSVTAGPPPAAPVANEQPAALPEPAAPSAAGGKDAAGGKNTAKPSTSPTRRAARSSAPAANGLKDGQFAGAPATNPYGQIKVTLTVSDGRITAANATYPTAGQSASINASAIPKLRQATLAAQSAKVDSVSGATFTSEAYLTSLQGALDAAKS